SATVYSICETAKANNLNPYYYLEYLFTELPKLCDKDGNIDPTQLDPLLPWAAELPAKCHKPRRED
ncbi:MAG: transposase domain-containing protein, partial [Lachnospiraceae bacterium]|nr:transposase domain-containing protein [Lachnospiraceae bacterium]